MTLDKTVGVASTLPHRDMKYYEGDETTVVSLNGVQSLAQARNK